MRSLSSGIVDGPSGVVTVCSDQRLLRPHRAVRHAQQRRLLHAVVDPAACHSLGLKPSRREVVADVVDGCRTSRRRPKLWAGRRGERDAEDGRAASDLFAGQQRHLRRLSTMRLRVPALDSTGSGPGAERSYNPAASRFYGGRHAKRCRREHGDRDSARAAARFFLPSDCLACRDARAEELFSRAASARDCWDALPAARGGALRALRRDAARPRRRRRDLRALPARSARLRAAARGRALSRLGARDPARVQVPRRRLPRAAAGRALMARRLGRAGRATRSPRCPRRSARGGRAATTRPRSSPRPSRARLGLPFAAGRLVKRRETEVQSRLPARAARRATCAARFAVRGPARRRVLLVDDVATSGATARECARRLARAGARRRHRLVLRARLARRLVDRSIRRSREAARTGSIVRTLPLVPEGGRAPDRLALRRRRDARRGARAACAA